MPTHRRSHRDNSRSSPFRSVVALGALASVAVMVTAYSTGLASRLGATSTPSPSSPSPATPSPSISSPSIPSPSAPVTPTITPAPYATGNPFSSSELYVPHSHAERAAHDAPEGRDKDLLTRLAATPTALWLTPERLPMGKVGPEVRRVLTEAANQRQVAVLAIYGIPQRDCTAGYSSGGLPATDYLTWIEEIAAELDGAAVVILEPDALAAAEQCGLVDERTELVANAAHLLSARSAVYLDAGHTTWVPPDRMADLLSRAGVSDVRGFAVGVAGYGHVDAERAFGEEIARLLGDTHFVIDTSRSGNGPADDWCNPPGRALGPEPSAVDDGGSLDALLWVKPPGESDGTCGGGPAAGEFWPQRALELATAAGW